MIRILDDRLVNQIAAGEVVDRPASIVKELIENSLDAGASHVTVSVEQGGLRRIGVQDDGAGMAEDELPLALSRHATSKIDSMEALARVASLGFRGEALASIASVADVDIRTRAGDAARGSRITDATTAEVQPTAMAQGTRVEVHELFARVPARRQFMRTAATEFRHIQQAFTQLALSRFDVAFDLVHNDRRTQHLPAAADEAEKRDRIRRLLGADFESHALAVDERIAGVRLTGWLATPGFSRHRADLAHWFVNRRAIRDRLLAHAVRAAYRDMLHSQRYPAFVLYLDVDRRTIDVNVHPAKSEIRFREPKLVHDFVTRSVDRTLQHDDSTPNTTRLADLPLAAPSSSHSNHTADGDTGHRGPPRADWPASAPAGDRQYRFQMPQFGGVADTPTQGETPQVASAISDSPLGHAIGQLHGIFILAENEHGLVVVDMHAAHERVLYEKLKADYSAGAIASRPLLVPASVAVDPEHVAVAEANRHALQYAGFDLAPSADDRLRLLAVPELIAEGDYLSVFRDALSELESGLRGVDHVRDVIDDVLADVGCKAAIKAGRRLTIAEMNALLADMHDTQRAGHCNHGRPSWVQVDRDGLDRLFMRGQ